MKKNWIIFEKDTFFQRTKVELSYRILLFFEFHYLPFSFRLKFIYDKFMASKNRENIKLLIEWHLNSIN